MTNQTAANSTAEAQQEIARLVMAERAKGFTARQALANVVGQEAVDAMISDLYETLRAKYNEQNA